ncbi:hypothetical protein [Pseudomonas sp. EMN2]|uniref:hypothetical protein n=1 Tax=Pseudomonas sp. EMN2 TaxID=2615212 RepID=UPI00129A53BE|nr:hypothetical protein [Pseudomonas sp. EMN2]
MSKNRQQAMRGAAKPLRRYQKNCAGPGGRIGLGLASSLKPKKIQRDEVLLDAQTTAQTNANQSTLRARLVNERRRGR